MSGQYRIEIIIFEVRNDLEATPCEGGSQRVDTTTDVDRHGASFAVTKQLRRFERLLSSPLRRQQMQ